MLVGGFTISAQAHSGPPVSLIIGSLWGTLSYLAAATLFILASKKGQRLKRLLLCLAGFPVWWCAVEFSVAPFLDYPPWDTAIAIIAPLALLAFGIRHLIRARNSHAQGH